MFVFRGRQGDLIKIIWWVSHCRAIGPSDPGAAASLPPASPWCSDQWRTMARYQVSSDRKGQHPKDHLSKYTGWMHADGYAGFEDLYRSGEIREVACLAHVRRKFAASSPMSTRPKARPLQTRPSSGLLNFTPSRRRHEGCHRISAPRSGRLRPNLPSTDWRLG